MAHSRMAAKKYTAFRYTTVVKVVFGAVLGLSATLYSLGTPDGASASPRIAGVAWSHPPNRERV
jgi:hypothetical protein